MSERITRAAIFGFCVAAMLAAGEAAPAAQSPNFGTACAKLSALTAPGIRIVSAADIPAGPFTPPGGAKPLTLPAFCRVEAVASPVADSSIAFEVWMPKADAWTGRFQGVGNGGYTGDIGYAAMASALTRGSAVTSTDAGHTGGDLEFGLGHPEKVVDWSHRAMHVTAEAAKLIVRNHLGKFPTYSYFVGCSSGGHQAVSEAQRYPEDYDGILAGDPAFDRTNQTLGYLAMWLATHDAAGVALIPAAKLPLLTKAAVAACDANDGLADGLIDDPRQCKFDPAALLCTEKTGAACLTRTEVDAARRVYDGARSPTTGEQIYPGWLPGSESFGANAGQSWRQVILDPPSPMRVEVLSYFLFKNPAWDWRSIDWDRDVRFARERLAMLSAVDPDLRPFKARGGKLLMYSGWADPLLPGTDITNYYDDVVKTLGGPPHDFFRLFMVPGMGHCGGGPGPNTFDALAPLEAWVERGSAPASIVASSVVNGVTTRTRPLCPYPQVARWKGAGSTDDAASFACVAPGKTSR
jgi:feruloyl esterase